MRAFVSNLTVAMLLIHALVGCCRHHEHNCCESTIERDSLAAGCCHDDHASGDHEHEAPTPPGQNTFGCQGVCTYLPPQKVLIDAPQLVNSIDFLAIVPTTANGYAAAGTFWDRTRVAQAPEPPLRLHLLHQIILV